jgi:hypothetical protein
MRHHQLLLAFVALSLSAGSGAIAAERNWTVQGHGLRIDSPCAKLVVIEPATGLGDAVEVKAIADRDDEIDRLSVTGGGGVTIGKNASRCASGPTALNIGPLTFGVTKETLKVTVRVPIGTAIEIQGHDSTDYRIGAVGGPLIIAEHSSGDLRATKVTDLSVQLSGSGDVTIDEVAGKIDANLHGSGDLKLHHVNASATALFLSGSGDVEIDDGDLGALTADLHGSGDVKLPSSAGLQLNASGAGDVTMRHVAGPVNVMLTGSASLTVDAVDSATVSLRETGHGDIRIGGGHIVSLAFEGHGSGDLSVDAVVGDAAINITGSADVTLNHVTGHVSQNRHGSGKITIGGGQ